MKLYFTVLIIIIFMLSACSSGDTDAEKAFANCMNKMSQDFEKANPGKSLPPDIMEKMGGAACKIIKTECNKDPEGAVCQSLLDKYM